jgi:hypothetical protein
MRPVLMTFGVLFALASAADAARRYVGTTGGTLGASSVVTRVRWRGAAEGDGRGPWTGSILKARYRCRAEDPNFQAIQCPSARRGKILAELQHPGDFYGPLTFKDGTICRVVGSLASNSGALWEEGQPPQQAPRMMMQLCCSTTDRGPSCDDYEKFYGFIGDAP